MREPIIDAKNGLFLDLLGQAALDSGNPKFGAASLILDATTGTYARLNNIFSAYLSPGVPMTLEMWLRPISRVTGFPCVFSNYSLYSSSSLAIFAGHGGGNTSKYQVAIGNSVFPSIQSSADIAYGAYVHLALTKTAGNVFTLWLDGVSQGTYTWSNTLDRSDPFTFGASADALAATLFNGNIDEIRLTSDCRYTSGFTPPTSAFGEDVGADAFWNSVLFLFHLDATESPSLDATGQLFDKSLYAPLAASFQAQDDVSKLFDLQYGGNGRIFGTVKVDSSPDVPVYRRVWLMNQRDAVVIRETWSDETTGEYEFTNIDETQKYSVISFDHTNNFRAVIADSVVPELMP